MCVHKWVISESMFNSFLLIFHTLRFYNNKYMAHSAVAAVAAVVMLFEVCTLHSAHSNRIYWAWECLRALYGHWVRVNLTFHSKQILSLCDANSVFVLMMLSCVHVLFLYEKRQTEKRKERKRDKYTGKFLLSKFLSRKNVRFILNKLLLLCRPCCVYFYRSGNAMLGVVQ